MRFIQKAIQQRLNRGARGRLAGASPSPIYRRVSPPRRFPAAGNERSGGVPGVAERVPRERSRRCARVLPSVPDNLFATAPARFLTVEPSALPVFEAAVPSAVRGSLKRAPKLIAGVDGAPAWVAPQLPHPELVAEVVPDWAETEKLDWP